MRATGGGRQGSVVLSSEPDRRSASKLKRLVQGDEGACEEDVRPAAPPGASNNSGATAAAICPVRGTATGVDARPGC